MADVHHAAGRKGRGRNRVVEVPTAERPLHRIADVRQREGMSLRGISRKVRVEVRNLKRQERENADLRLSDLYRWQEALFSPPSVRARLMPARIPVAADSV